MKLIAKLVTKFMSALNVMSRLSWTYHHKCHHYDQCFHVINLMFERSLSSSPVWIMLAGHHHKCHDVMLSNTGEPVWECVACNEQQSRSDILEVFSPLSLPLPLPLPLLLSFSNQGSDTISIKVITLLVVAGYKSLYNQHLLTIALFPSPTCDWRWWRGWRSSWRRCLTAATHLSGKHSCYTLTKNFIPITSFAWRYLLLYLSLYLSLYWSLYLS